MAILVTFMWLSILYEPFLLLFFAIFFPITITILIASVVSLIKTLIVKSRGWKVISVIHVINFLLFCLVFSGYGIPSPSAFTMEKHYESHKKELMELVRYTQNAIDSAEPYRIEYERFHPYNNEIPDSASMVELGLTQAELDTLIDLLISADCHGIYSTGPKSTPEVLYRRDGLGAFYYFLRMLGTDQEEWAPFCSEAGYTLTTYNDSVLFTYGSGAIGSDRFPNLAEYEKARPDIARQNEYYRSLSQDRNR